SAAAKSACSAKLSRRPGLISRLAPGCVTGLRLVIGWIKAGKFHTFLDLAENPTFIQFVFGAFLSDGLDQVLRNDHRAIVLHDNHVAWKHGTTAAPDRPLPAHKRKTIDSTRPHH